MGKKIIFGINRRSFESGVIDRGGQYLIIYPSHLRELCGLGRLCSSGSIDFIGTPKGGVHDMNYGMEVLMLCCFPVASN